jgi:hypothetical protein
MDYRPILMGLLYMAGSVLILAACIAAIWICAYILGQVGLSGYILLIFCVAGIASYILGYHKAKENKYTGLWEEIE